MKCNFLFNDDYITTGMVYFFENVFKTFLYRDKPEYLINRPTRASLISLKTENKSNNTNTQKEN